MLVPPANLVGRAKATIKECSVTEVKDCLSADTLIIDVRELAEYQKGHIPAAILLPRGLLEFEIHGLIEHARGDRISAPEDQPVLLYCGTGGRSALAAETLALMGYRNVTSMAGGIVAWAAAKLPVATPGG